MLKKAPLDVVFQGSFSTLQRQMRHAVHVFFFKQECANGHDTKSDEKQQQGADAEPLYAFYGLKQIFVHFSDCKLLIVNCLQRMRLAYFLTLMSVPSLCK